MKCKSKTKPDGRGWRRWPAHPLSLTLSRSTRSYHPIISSRSAALFCKRPRRTKHRDWSVSTNRRTVSHPARSLNKPVATRAGWRRRITVSQGPERAAPYRIVSLSSFYQLAIRSSPWQAVRLCHLSCPWSSQRLESGFSPAHSHALTMVPTKENGQCNPARRHDAAVASFDWPSRSSCSCTRSMQIIRHLDDGSVKR